MLFANNPKDKELNSLASIHFMRSVSSPGLQNTTLAQLAELAYDIHHLYCMLFIQ